MTEYTSVFVPGTIFWPKIVGQKALHDNYDATHGGPNPGRQWQYELVPDDQKFLKEHRLLDRLKEVREGGIETGEYLVLKKPEFTKEGAKNEPIRIVNDHKEPWNDSLLGNGTKVVAKLTIADFGKGKKKAIWTDALMVTEHIPYESDGGSGDRGDPFGDYPGSSGRVKGVNQKDSSPLKSKPKTAELDDIDDDMPF